MSLKDHPLKGFVIFVVTEKVPSADGSIQDMVDETARSHPRGSWHGKSLAKSAGSVKTSPHVASVLILSSPERASVAESRASIDSAQQLSLPRVLSCCVGSCLPPLRGRASNSRDHSNCIRGMTSRLTIL